MVSVKQEYRLKSWVVPSVLGVIGLILVFSSITIVGTGERGVLKQFGKVTGTVFDEGLNWKVPIVQSVDKFNVQVQKAEGDSGSASKDLQIVTTTVAVNYQVLPSAVVWLRQNVGMDYFNVVLQPSIHEAVKASTARYTAEELITKRGEVRDLIQLTLQNKLDGVTKGSIAVRELNIVNFEFGEEFDNAIEAKVTAEQKALEAEWDLQRIKVEAQQKIERAKAEAESIRIQAETLKQDEGVLRLRWIEKWNGVMPLYVGDSSTLLTIGVD